MGASRLWVEVRMALCMSNGAQLPQVHQLAGAHKHLARLWRPIIIAGIGETPRPTRRTLGWTPLYGAGHGAFSEAG